ncbi:hypothetical protein MASR1M90_16310 [Desulfovibrionales bacterium]
MCDVWAAQYKEEIEMYKERLCSAEEIMTYAMSDNPLTQGN